MGSVGQHNNMDKGEVLQSLVCLGEPLLGWHAVDGNQGVHGKGRERGKHIVHGGVCESGDIGNYSEGISGNRVSVWSATTSFRGLLV